ncbi:MAG TPA: hypothetical protein VJ306_05685, partial [Pyrinomonadaceae bacterium]|nr:hypothetical protein [Pyrinomonadaceae bacterium]
GRYIGYKANYYTPEVYKAILNYCGFDVAATESGRDEINHVLVANKLEMESRALKIEQVRKRGLPPPSQQRGQATLPDLFYSDLLR